MDDRVLVYRGADQPDMSVINPESDVWQHIKVGDGRRWFLKPAVALFCTLFGPARDGIG